MDGDTIVVIGVCDSYNWIAMRRLVYLFLDYNIPVFSNFPFIRSASEDDYDKTLSKFFPKEYHGKKPIGEFDWVTGDEPTLVLYFRNNKFLRKEWFNIPQRKK